MADLTVERHRKRQPIFMIEARGASKGNVIVAGTLRVP
jgi:hypothetical protein